MTLCGRYTHDVSEKHPTTSSSVDDPRIMVDAPKNMSQVPGEIALLHIKKNKMEIEEAKKLKAELETGIRELLWQFTAKTGLYFREIILYEEPIIEEQYTQLTHIEVKTALPEEVSSRRDLKIEDTEKKLRGKGISLEEIESIKRMMLACKRLLDAVAKRELENE